MRTTDFTDKLGFTAPFKETLDNMSHELRVRVWDGFQFFLADDSCKFKHETVVLKFWSYLLYPLDEVHSNYPWTIKNMLKKAFFELQAQRIYGLLHFIVEQISEDQKFWHTNGQLLSYKIYLINVFNEIFIETNAACRFVNNTLIPITDPAEVDSIKLIFNCNLEGVKKHIHLATVNLNQRDYPGCAKQSIDAIEDFARIIEEKPTETLGNLIKPLCKKLELDTTFSDLLGRLWGFASQNIRHSQQSAAITIEEPEARFFLVTCCSIINYMLSRLGKN